MFAKEMESLADTLLGLREFVGLLHPFLREKAKATFRSRARELAPLGLAIAKTRPDLVADIKPFEHMIARFFDGKVVVKKRRGGDASGLTISITGPGGFAFGKALHEVEAAERRIDLLYISSLISLISAVECFLAQVVYKYYDTVPGAVPDKDKLLSLEDLKSFDSVLDARAYVVEKKVVDLMRGSFADWIGFFKSRVGLSMGYLDPYMDMLVETCERRNLLAHNAGVVNSIYLSKVATGLAGGAKKGHVITVTPGYLEDRIDYFELHSLLIAAELWKKLNVEDPARASCLEKITYEHVKAGRWRIAEGLACFQRQDNRMPEENRLVGQLNEWLSIKRQGHKRWAEVKPDVEKANFCAKGLLFQMARLSLLEKADEFFQMAPRSVKSKEICVHNVQEFPIFDEMRGDRRFPKLLGMVRGDKVGIRRTTRGKGATTQRTRRNKGGGARTLVRTR